MDWTRPFVLLLCCGPCACTLLDPLDDLSKGSGGGGPGFEFVRIAAATPQSPTRTVRVAFDGSQTAGDLNLVVIGWSSPGLMVRSVTDSNGNPYAAVSEPTLSGTTAQTIYFCARVASGDNTVTVEFDDAAMFPDVRVVEYTGSETTPSIARAASNKGSSATASAGPVKTDGGRELVFAAATTQGLFADAGDGFIERIITVTDGDIVEDMIVEQSGSVTAGAEQAPQSTSEWVMQVVVLR